MDATKAHSCARISGTPGDDNDKFPGFYCFSLQHFCRCNLNQIMVHNNNQILPNMLNYPDFNTTIMWHITGLLFLLQQWWYILSSYGNLYHMFFITVGTYFDGLISAHLSCCKKPNLSCFRRKHAFHILGSGNKMFIILDLRHRQATLHSLHC